MNAKTVTQLELGLLTTFGGSQEIFLLRILQPQAAKSAAKVGVSWLLLGEHAGVDPNVAKPAAKAGVSWLLLGEHAGVDLNVAKPAAKAGVNCRRRRGSRCLKVTGYRVLPTGEVSKSMLLYCP